MSTVTAATVEALLRVRDAGFTVSMKQAEAQTKKAEGAVKSLHDRLESVSALGSKVGGALSLGVTAPLLALGTAAVKTTVQMDSLRRGLTTVAGSSAEAERQLVRLRKIADLPGLGFKEAIQGSIRLQAAGYSAKQAEAALREFGNAVATVGGGKEQLDGVTLALSQIASKGKVSAEEINQLAERMPQVRKAMEAAFGTSNTEILQKANITANEFLDAMTLVLSKDKRMGDSLANQFEVAREKITESLDRIGKAVAPKVASTLGSIADAVDKVTAAFDRLPKEQQDILVRLGIAGLVAGPALTAVAKMAELATSLKSLGASMALLKNLGNAGAIVLAVTLAFSPHASVQEETDGLNEKARNQDNTLPRYLKLKNALPHLRERARYMGSMAHSAFPAAGPNDVEFQALSIAGLGPQASERDIQSAISRLEQETIQAKVDFDKQARAQSPRAARARGEAAQKKIQQAVIDATKRAKREQEEAEAKRKLKRQQEEKAENDRRFTEDAAKRAKDAADRLAEATMSRLALSQREARRNYQEDRYYGVPGADAILRTALQKNAIDFTEKSFGGFSLSGMLSGAGQEASALQGKRQAGLQKGEDSLEKSLAASTSAGLESLAGTLKALKAKQERERKWGEGELKGIDGSMGSSMSSLFGSLGGTLESLQRGSLRRRAGLFGQDAARDAGGIARSGFYDLVAGRDVIGNAVKRVQTTAMGALGDEIGRAVERSLRKRLTSVFEDAVSKGVGEKLSMALNGSLKGISASAGAILSGAYSLISALNRKKSFGVGTALGLIGGALTGGISSALMWGNIGNAIDNNDWGGVIGGLASKGLSSAINTGSNHFDSPWAEQSVKGRAVTIQVVHNGNNYNEGDAGATSLRIARSVERSLTFG